MRTREAILDAAHTLYLRHGINETSVEAIATLAAVSVGSVYSHFGSKDGLALAVAGQAITDLEARLGTARSGRDALDRVRAAGDVYLQFATGHPALWRYITARAMNPAPILARESARQTIDRRLRTALLVTARDLKEAMDDGQIRRMPLDALVIALWALCAGVSEMTSRCDALSVTPDLAARALRLGTTLILGGPVEPSST